MSRAPLDPRAPLYKAVQIARRRAAEEGDSSWRVVAQAVEELARRVERIYELASRHGLSKPFWLSPRLLEVLRSVEEGDKGGAIERVRSISESLLPAGLAGEYSLATGTAARVLASIIFLAAAAYIGVEGLQAPSTPAAVTTLALASFALASLLAASTHYSLYLLAVSTGASLALATAYRPVIDMYSTLMALYSAVLGFAAAAYSSYTRRKFYRMLRRLERGV
ncbi:hypothetical protein [Aeropyrum camini]|uniref:Uncharacterized protein n=1 Tax=Aeropyrum camini SY1 = JCM 12091 TaxID=1198449 RepID=U3TCL0_9CREN|nr:hypothetical protein [Aeropyrum camini]BAN90146.1 hypothetical protein ACAM_0677 [Aeropyrum camini SY1 = JCM 12091]